MTKNTAIMIVVLVVGLLVGGLIGEILSPWVPFLSATKAIEWEPRADLDILKYHFYIQVKLNLASVLGLILAFWLYRKL